MFNKLKYKYQTINPVAKKTIFSVLLAAFFYLAVLMDYNISCANTPFLLVFVLSAVLIFRAKPPKDCRKLYIFAALFFALLYVAGRLCQLFAQDSSQSIFRAFFSFQYLVMLVGYAVFFYYFAVFVFPPKFLAKLQIYKQWVVKKPRRVFWTSFAILFAWYFIFFLLYFPGILTSDSVNQIGQVDHNLTIVSNHHPVAHTLFIAGPYYIGRALFHDVTASVACATLAHVIFMAAAFAFVVTYFYKQGVNKKIIIAMVIYYLLPHHAFYSVTIWKDVVFGVAMPLFILSLYHLSRLPKITFKNLLTFLLTSLMVVFFRNNGFFMFVMLAIPLVIYFKHNRKIMLISVSVIIAARLIVFGPVFSTLHIGLSSSAESLSIPLQQLARMSYKGITLSDEESSELSRYLDYEVAGVIYNPVVVDAIKDNAMVFHVSEYDNDKVGFFKIYLKLCLEHFPTAVEAFLTSSYGYWYPDVTYWYVGEPAGSIRVDNQEGLDLAWKPILPGGQKLFETFGLKHIPVLQAIWSIGLCLWAIICAFLNAMFIHKNRRVWILYLPIFFTFATLLIAAPVFGEYRYFYSEFTALPILLLAPYLKTDKYGKIKS